MSLKQQNYSSKKETKRDCLEMHKKKLELSGKVIDKQKLIKEKQRRLLPTKQPKDQANDIVETENPGGSRIL